jgi:hypothetical protein
MSLISFLDPDEKFALCKNVDPTLSRSTPIPYSSILLAADPIYKGPYVFFTKELNLPDGYEACCLDTRKTGPPHVRDMIISLEREFLPKVNRPRNWFIPELFRKLYDLDDVCDAEVDHPFDLLVGIALGYLDRVAPSHLCPSQTLREQTLPKFSAHTGMVQTAPDLLASAQLKGCRSKTCISGSYAGLYYVEILETAIRRAKFLDGQDCRDYRIDEDFSTLGEVDSTMSYNFGFLRLNRGPKKPRLVACADKSSYLLQVAILKRVFLNPMYKTSGYTMCHLSNVVRRAKMQRKLWRFWSLDWELWDYHVILTFMKAAFRALGIHLDLLGDPVFLDAALESMYSPVFYNGRVHGWKGRVRSGTGLFVLINNMVNAIACFLIIFECLDLSTQVEVTRWIRDGCPGNKFNWMFGTFHGDDGVVFLRDLGMSEEEFLRISSDVARKWGMVLKPEAQFLNADCFVACRVVFNRFEGWSPRPILASILWNAVRPEYLPNAYINANRFHLALRYRDEKQAMLFHPAGNDLWRLLMKQMQSHGVEDPTLPDLSQSVIADHSTVDLAKFRLTERLLSASGEHDLAFHQITDRDGIDDWVTSQLESSE